ncbi:MAG: nucleotide sugar dehydrogenase [Candidatus Hydrogenedentes bacterium]|nr:nucleotide sugar dehydrogenase [Candidatus Hydrogenedentota bacterium]
MCLLWIEGGKPVRDTLFKKLADGSAVGGVIGLGYVGLPLVQHLCAVGYRVIGFDVDDAKVQQLSEGHSYIRHIPSEWIADVVGRRRFDPTADFNRLSEPDCISICVPTPLDKNREPDLQYVRATAEDLSRTLRPGQLIVLESTTYPGTTTELVLPILESSGLEVGKDFFLAFSPEREDPGNPRFTISNIPKVVGGVTDTCSEVAAQYYSRIFQRIVPVTTPEAAELCKLLENIFRSVNIALVNELKILCDRMGIDIWEVIDAAATKPFGYMPFYPGPGLGGHCIPIDPYYLSWRAREFDFVTRFIELSGEINTSMPMYVVTRTMEALNDRGKPMRGARILVLGAAYKKDIDDIRESPSVKLIQLLQERGAEVDYNDPYVPRISPGRHHSLELESVDLSAETLAKYDCVLISTAHTAYDPAFIVANARLLVDTRNMTRGIDCPPGVVVKA